MWGEAVLDMAEGSEHVCGGRVSELREEMAAMPDKLRHKPYMRLKKLEFIDDER